MTVMQALREATWATHLRLEKRLEIKRLFSELVRYRDHIARLEARTSECPFSGDEPPFLGGQVRPAPVFRALPHFRSWLSFEGSHKPGCHPAAIKPARLGENADAIHKTFELRGVKRKVIAYCLKAWEGLGITPPHALEPLTRHRDYSASIWVRSRIASFNDVPQRKSFASLGMFPGFS